MIPCLAGVASGVRLGESGTTMADGDGKVRRQWLALGTRIVRLLWHQPERTGDLVRRSYDRIAAGYDQAWTHHMHGMSMVMLDRLSPPPGASCVDLACGTGFLTGELARRTGGRVVGVDSSPGMLTTARNQHRARCTFIEADAVAHLRSLPRSSVDVVTCGWGLGYTRPWLVVREVARVLRPGGRVGIIDNTLWSLTGVLWASLLTFAERPEALGHVMRVCFLPAGWALAFAMRACGLAVLATCDGRKTYHVPDGRAAVARLTATGAAAGFEFAAHKALRDQILARFATILERRFTTDDGVPITHRYLAAIGQKR